MSPGFIHFFSASDFYLASFIAKKKIKWFTRSLKSLRSIFPHHKDKPEFSDLDFRPCLLTNSHCAKTGEVALDFLPPEYPAESRIDYALGTCS
jgi:hypothetical protein